MTFARQRLEKLERRLTPQSGLGNFYVVEGGFRGDDVEFDAFFTAQGIRITDRDTIVRLMFVDVAPDGGPAPWVLPLKLTFMRAGGTVH